MIGDFFDHTCDVYHLQKAGASPGYNLPSSPTFSHGGTPDLSGVPCHFGVKSANIVITQEEPANELDARIKLAFPAGTDIRINDKIVWLETGLEYTAEQPRNIRGHHGFVYIKRTRAQRPL